MFTSLRILNSIIKYMKKIYIIIYIYIDRYIHMLTIAIKIITQQLSTSVFNFYFHMML